MGDENERLKDLACRQNRALLFAAECVLAYSQGCPPSCREKQCAAYTENECIVDPKTCWKIYFMTGGEQLG